jgi:hypothetical protein
MASPIQRSVRPLRRGQPQPFAGWGRAVLMALLLGTGIVTPAAAQVGPLPATCEVPSDLLADGSPLPNVAKKAKLERRLKIIALGSSSTLGVGATGLPSAFPARLEAALARMLPDVSVQVLNKGISRQTAHDMVERIDTEVLPEEPALVIWESGTAEAVRNAEIDVYSNVLLAGIDKLTSHGIDVVLMDTQYSRSTAQLINFHPYVATIERVASMRDLVLFPRYSMMRYWVEADRFSFADRSPAGARKVADIIYDCVGQLLARQIVQATKLAK